METYELRYFLGIAKHENVHRASVELRVSPGSLSKAVARLESELGVSLFSRAGRNIQLTDQGRLLQRRASRIVQLEESARVEIAGHQGRLNVVISGPEVLLGRYGIDLAGVIRKTFPNSHFELRAADDLSAMRHVRSGESHLAVISCLPEQGLRSKVLGEVRFVTCAGKGHPLYRSARSGASVPVEEILKHDFVSPSLPILGEIGNRQSLDGWRDDRFPRKVAYRTTSLKLLEELVRDGKAIAYIPDYLAERIEAGILRLTGCPYSCSQSIRLVADAHPESGWINQLY